MFFISIEGPGPGPAKPNQAKPSQTWARARFGPMGPMGPMGPIGPKICKTHTHKNKKVCFLKMDSKMGD